MSSGGRKGGFSKFLGITLVFKRWNSGKSRQIIYH